MASLDEELRIDAEEDAREADFILSQLPADLKERYSKDDILRLMDLDLEQVADAVCKKAKKEGQGDYKADEVFFVVQADLDYQEQTL